MLREGKMEHREQGGGNSWCRSKSTIMALGLAMCVWAGGGCCTTRLWASWEGTFSPDTDAEQNEVYRVGDRGYLILIVLRTRNTKDTVLGPTPTYYDMRWYYVPVAALAPTKEPGTRLCAELGRYHVPASQAVKLRRDNEVRTVEVARYVMSKYRAEGIIIDFLKDREQDGTNRLILRGNIDWDWKPWWCRPARIALTPVAVAGDILLIPVYAYGMIAIIAHGG
jgi:hypothetical protein